MDKLYIISAFRYAVIGSLFGIYIGASQDHRQIVTCLHILLLGFVFSFLYGLCFKLWVKKKYSSIKSNHYSKYVWIQFIFHHIGMLMLFISLFLFQGQFFPLQKLKFPLGLAAILFFIALVLMLILLLSSFSYEKYKNKD